jgi:hypothetical protein
MLLKERCKGQEDEEEYISSYWITNERILEDERGGTRPHSVESTLWRRLWTFHKTMYLMMMMMTTMTMTVMIPYKI